MPAARTRAKRAGTALSQTSQARSVRSSRSKRGSNSDTVEASVDCASERTKRVDFRREDFGGLIDFNISGTWSGIVNLFRWLHNSIGTLVDSLRSSSKANSSKNLVKRNPIERTATLSIGEVPQTSAVYSSQGVYIIFFNVTLTVC